MRRISFVLGVALLFSLGTGCVERRYVITTDPPGAAVYRNDEFIGNTPVDDTFVYYGNYNFTIRREGFATQQIRQDICTPWYQYWPLDFVSEVLWPFHVEDVRYFHYALQPLPPPNIPALLDRGQGLRNEGRTLAPRHPEPQAVRPAPAGVAGPPTAVTPIPPTAAPPPGIGTPLPAPAPVAPAPGAALPPAGSLPNPI